MRILFLLCLIVACTSSHDDELLKQSAEIQKSALEMGEKVGEKIKRIEAYSGEAEDPLRSILMDSATVLHDDYLYWESTIVEVPGYSIDDHHDHEGHEGHDHSHDHIPPPDVTPKMMLDIQEDLKDRIVKIDLRAQKILDTLETGNKNETI